MDEKVIVPSSALQEVCLVCVVIDRGTRSSFCQEQAGGVVMSTSVDVYIAYVL